MQAASFDEGLERILKKETRYHKDAYTFVLEALNFTSKSLGRESKSHRTRDEQRHVAPEELLSGARDYALQTFGPMALMLFEEWGIHSCCDLGEIVFILVENGVFRKTEQDSREAFEHGYDFEQTFREPYLPEFKRARRALEPRTTSV
jgi:uncharacterized repeat protein (TIGR04138 family)